MGQTLSEPVVEKVNMPEARPRARLHHNKILSVLPLYDRLLQTCCTTIEPKADACPRILMKVPMTAFSLASRPCKDGA